MTVFHLNCGSLYPLFPKGTQSILYCLLVETNKGLLLVDTGFGVQDYTQPTRFIRLFIRLLGMERRLEETAAYQIERRGFSREDVKDIVMTHLHCDHSGGLPDFPKARVHVSSTEYETAMKRSGLLGRFYEQAHWHHSPNWVVHNLEDSQDWFGFESVIIDAELKPEARLVSLPGHTRGHCGVAVETVDGWLLHCGDATYPFYVEGEPEPPLKPLPPVLVSPPGWIEKLVTGQGRPRLERLLRDHGDQVRLICSNDSISFAGLKDRDP